MKGVFIPLENKNATMNLHSIYYSDLRKSDEPMKKLYSKYYELHKLKHLSKAVTRRVFTQRINQYGRSLGEAIISPRTVRKGGNKPGKIMQEWLNHDGEKCTLACYRNRRKKGEPHDTAISNLLRIRK